MSLSKSASALRTIGEVAGDLDVATHVLRFWESKFHQIKPQKRRGRRYYKPEDVHLIIKIKNLLRERGYTIRGVQKFLAAEVKNKNTIQDENNKSLSCVLSQNDKADFNSVKPNILANNVMTPVESFRTDMFGNAIPASGFIPKNNVLSHPVGNRYSEDDIVRLKKIYSGLLEARNSLKKIA